MRLSSGNSSRYDAEKRLTTLKDIRSNCLNEFKFTFLRTIQKHKREKLRIKIYGNIKTSSKIISTALNPVLLNNFEAYF